MSVNQQKATVGRMTTASEVGWKWRGPATIMKSVLELCPEFCPAIYDPLCGTDHNTYSSKCHLLEHNCKTRGDLEEEGRGSEFVEIDVAARGECPTLPVHAKSQVK